jgi:subtilisin family serine protease
MSGRSYSLILACVVAAGACRESVAPVPPPLEDPTTRSSIIGPQEAEYVVVLRSSAGDPKTFGTSIAQSLGGRLKRTWTHALKGLVIDLPASGATALRGRPEVASVELNALVEPAAQLNPPWGLDRIDQRPLPLDHQYSYTWTGAGVHVYIIDSGIRATHVDFGGRAFGGTDLVHDGNGTGDCNGHGTHVASLGGGSINGVAKSAFLHPVRVFGCAGGADVATIIDAIDWIVAHDVAPAVTNLSLGGGFSAALNAAVNGLAAEGHVVTTAAGNNSADACGYSPASAVSVLAVAATNGADTRPAFSNMGGCVDLFAPGVGIAGASHLNNVDQVLMTGTSMSSAFVAGAAAKLRQQFPAWNQADVRAAILAAATPNAVIGPAGAPNRLLFSR